MTLAPSGLLNSVTEVLREAGRPLLHVGSRSKAGSRLTAEPVKPGCSLGLHSVQLTNLHFYEHSTATPMILMPATVQR